MLLVFVIAHFISAPYLIILFITWFPPCILAVGPDSSNAFPPVCATSFGTTPWWLPLKTASGVRDLDPCQLPQIPFFQQNLDFLCCFFGEPDPGRHGTILPHFQCAPCDVETYNMAVACLACQIPSAIPPTENDIGSLTFSFPFPNTSFPLFTEWQQGSGPKNPSNASLFSGINWLQALPSNGRFDINAALSLANGLTPLPTSTSSGGAFSTSTTVVNSPPQFSSSSRLVPTADPAPTTAVVRGSHSKTAAIAGAATGGVILLILFTSIVAFLHRRRNLQRINNRFEGSTSSMRATMGTSGDPRRIEPLVILSDKDLPEKTSNSSDSPPSVPSSISEETEVSRSVPPLEGRTFHIPNADIPTTLSLLIAALDSERRSLPLRAETRIGSPPPAYDIEEV